MGTHYTPKWKDKDGNVMIFPARNTLFDDFSDAHDWQLGHFIFMVPFGLSPSGVMEFEADDGKCEIPHVSASLLPLSDNACVIAGPMFDAARTEARSK